MMARRALLGAMLVGFVVCGQARASEMQLEGDVSLGDGYSVLELGFTYFLQPLQDSEHPYELQPFMQRTPFLQATFSAFSSDFFDMNVVDLNGRFFMPEPVADLFLRPHVTLVDIAGSSATGWSLDLGYYVMDNMVVTLPGLAYGSFESGADVLEIDLDVIAAEHVHPMGEQNLYLLGSYSFDAERLTLGAVYYLDKSLGIGGEIALYDGGPAITVGASYWLHQGLGVRGSLTFDDGDAELSVGVVARF